MERELRTHWGDIYHPLPTQLRFHQSEAKYRAYVGYIGSGKSLSGSMEALLTAIDEPGYRPGLTVIARDTYPNLMNTTWQTFSQVVKQTCADMIKDEKKSTHQIEITLKNGWRFMGANLANYENFGSLEADYVYVDEINDVGVGAAAWDMLCGRLRGRYGKRRAWGSGNPAGKNWAYTRFFKHRLEGGNPLKNHEGFQPSPTENIHLPEGYLEELRDFYGEAWISKFLEGSFDVYEGAILPELNPELHLIDGFRIPDEWPRYRGLDHGLNHPTACIWIAVDYDGNHYAYREYVKSEAVPAVNARAILEMSQGEEEMTQWTVIDPSTDQRQTAGGVMQQIVDGYRDAGLTCRKGNNDVRGSIAVIKRLLRPEPAHIFPRWHWQSGELGAPYFFVTRDCKVLWNQLQLWRWKAVRPGGSERERPLDQQDDTVSALRYNLMEVPRAPTARVQKPLHWLEAELAERYADRDLESAKNLIGA